MEYTAPLQTARAGTAPAKPPLPLRIFLTLASLLLLVGLLFCTLRGIINDRAFFADTYARIGQAAYMGMSNEELVDSTMAMIHYMEGTRDSIDITVTVHGAQVSMFNDRERDHMVDVRALYQGWRTAAYCFLGLYAITALALILRKKPLRWLVLGFFKGSAAFVLVGVLLGGWILLDFSSFWTAFHHLFFSNDLWLLDPATSRMINMMPLELFFGIVSRMGARFLGLWAALLAVCGAAEVALRRKIMKN